jgi:hypothetical protein
MPAVARKNAPVSWIAFYSKFKFYHIKILNSSSILHPVEWYTVVVFRRKVSFLSLVPSYPSRIRELVRPDHGGTTKLRYLGNSLAFLLQDINTSTRK